MLFVGLGNPGISYANTRHNVGFWWLSKICDLHNADLNYEKKFLGKYGKVFVNLDNGTKKEIHLLMPETYMNLSGQAVSLVVNHYGIHPENVLVAHDDLDLPVGTVKFKIGGGHQGHNGLRSIVSCIGSGSFKRLRFGIGRPEDRSLVSNYVLSNASKSEVVEINLAIEKSLAMFNEYCN